jgi:hypothetical protein
VICSQTLSRHPSAKTSTGIWKSTGTRTEYLRESGQGEDEWEQGDLRAAFIRFTQLLACIEAQPAGVLLGRGPYEHCTTYAFARLSSRNTGISRAVFF